jgi:hypothetical protein
MVALLHGLSPGAGETTDALHAKQGGNGIPGPESQAHGQPLFGRHEVPGFSAVMGAGSWTDLLSW